MIAFFSAPFAFSASSSNLADDFSASSDIDGTDPAT
jgi:hypothetical protein